MKLIVILIFNKSIIPSAYDFCIFINIFFKEEYYFEIYYLPIIEQLIIYFINK